MNSSPRLASGKVPEWMTAHLKGNRYVNTIYLCASAMNKISRASRIPRGRKVLRGMAGVKLPDIFVVPGEDGGRGGDEFAFMSCSTNKEVAVSYINAEKGLPILFEFDVGLIDRGAPLSFLSQYPSEDEVLIPPLSFLEVTGASWTMDTAKGAVTVFPVRISCNLKSLTMEQIEERRKADLVAQEPYLTEEFARDVEPVRKALLAYRDTYDVRQTMSSRAEAELRTMWENLTTDLPAKFNDDAHYVSAVSMAFNFKHNWLSRMTKLTFKKDPSLNRPALYAAIEAEAVDVIKALLAVKGAAVDALDDDGTTGVQFAAERGCAAALPALAEAGADLVKARDDGATALGLAVLSNHVGALQCLLGRRKHKLPALDSAVTANDILVERGEGTSSFQLVGQLAVAFMSPAMLDGWLLKGATPSGLMGEIGALLLSPGLAEAAKTRLSNVRAFINHHASLLRDGADSKLPHVVKQLASQEPDGVFGAHAAIVAEAATDTPRLIDCISKSQAPHPCRFTITGKEAVRCVAYSKCGLWLARAEGSHIVVCDPVTGFQIFRLKGHAADVFSVAFSPDGQTLASGSKDQTVRVWSAEDGTFEKELKGHSGTVRSVSFSACGEYVASGSVDKSLRIWSAKDGACEKVLEGHSKDNEACKCTHGDMPWDYEANSDCPVQGHSNGIESIAWSPDGSRLASGSDDKTLKVWSAETGAFLNTFAGHTAPINDITFSPDGALVASCSGGHKNGFTDNSVRLWDVASGTEVRKFEDHSKDNQHCTCEFNFFGNLKKSNPACPVQGHSGWVQSIAWAPDGSKLASGSDDRTVKVWSAETGACLNTFAGHTDWVRSIAWTPDGSKLASGSNDKTVRLWSAETGAILDSSAGHYGTVYSVAWAPDGSQLASGSSDKTVRLWAAKNGACEKVLKGHSDSVTVVEFQDSGTLACRSDDGSTKFWDICTGTPKDEVAGEKFAFSKAVARNEQRAGHFLVTSEGSLVLVYHADGGEAIDVKKAPVAFFWSPSPVKSVACADGQIGVGCKNGAVLQLRAPWLVEG